jgi:hypothetical protein
MWIDVHIFKVLSDPLALIIFQILEHFEQLFVQMFMQAALHLLYLLLLSDRKLSTLLFNF